MAITDYLDTITSQHYDKPNFIAWLTANLNISDDLTDLLSSFDISFDIDTAVGNQLDILGEIVGVLRTLDFEPVDTSPVMLDEDYRFLLKSKIVQNTWDGTILGLYLVWANSVIDPNLIVQDNQNMSFNIILDGAIHTILLQELIVRGYLIPKPEGVRIVQDFVVWIRDYFQVYQSFSISTNDLIEINTTTPT